MVQKSIYLTSQIIPGEQKINNNFSKNFDERICRKLRLDEDDVASTITIELNDYIENNTYVVLDATVNINVKFGENDNVQKSWCSYYVILY